MTRDNCGRDIMVFVESGWRRQNLQVPVAAAVAAAILPQLALLVISSAVAHDLGKACSRRICPKKELVWAVAAAGAVLIAGLLGIYPPGFWQKWLLLPLGLRRVSSQLSWGLWKRPLIGAITGMALGLAFTFIYIIFYKFMFKEYDNPEHWLFNISPAVSVPSAC